MSRTRTVLVALATSAVTTVLLAGGLAWANHQFSDVPTSSAFHESIDNFVNGGCASGFPNQTFRPTDAVNRQQVARMFNACGGRVAFDTDPNPEAISTTFAPLNDSVTITSGAVGNGAGLVVVLATVTASSTSTTGYPCELQFRLVPNVGNLSYQALYEADLPANTADPDETTSVTGRAVLGPVSSGQVVTVEADTRLASSPACGASVVAEGDLVAMYVPFGADGAGGAEL